MTNTIKPPIWFWIISVIALLWNAMGVMNYLMQAYKTEGFVESITSEQLAVIEARPSWATALFALAVFTGVLGSLLLLLRKKFATPLLLVSLIGAIGTQIWWFTTDGPSISDQFQGTIMPIIVILFSGLLVWFSRKATTNYWIS